MTTVSIDPGTRAIGLAYWSDFGATLLAAGVSRAPVGLALGDLATWHTATAQALRPPGYVGNLAILERMESAGGRRATTVDDLLDVQAVGCMVAARVATTVHLVKPSEWKGTIPKAIHHARILEVLSPLERAIVDTATREAGATHAKEVLDAVGIGLYYLGRINRSGGARR